MKVDLGGPVDPRRSETTRPRRGWVDARALSPVHAAKRRGKVHPSQVNGWLWVVAPAVGSKDGWWPVVAYRIYGRSGTAMELHESALETVEDWEPVLSIDDPDLARLYEIVKSRR